jgi:hypothetical protein
MAFCLPGRWSTTWAMSPVFCFIFRRGSRFMLEPAWTTTLFMLLCSWDDRHTLLHPAFTGWDGGLINFLPGLALTCSPPDFLLLRSASWVVMISSLSYCTWLYLVLMWHPGTLFWLYKIHTKLCKGVTMKINYYNFQKNISTLLGEKNVIILIDSKHLPSFKKATPVPVMILCCWKFLMPGKSMITLDSKYEFNKRNSKRK